jgi:hypothetical protein
VLLCDLFYQVSDLTGLSLKVRILRGQLRRYLLPWLPSEAPVAGNNETHIGSHVES